MRIQLLERGWLSANTVLLSDDSGVTAIDTGYVSHVSQTLALFQQALAGRRLNRIINSHLHSDHCGGNAALTAKYGCDVLIPPGEAAAVAAWDEAALSYRPTGQRCDRFMYTGVVQPNDVLHMAGEPWQALAAPGHDPSSLIFYGTQSHTLVSADALWENGFGVVFPELDGDDAFAAVARTLDVIAGLKVRTVLPGHGAAFNDVAAALRTAYLRLDGFIQSPSKHARYAAKVLCIYWLMEVQPINVAQAKAYLAQVPLIQHIAQRFFACSPEALLDDVLQEMTERGQISVHAGQYHTS